MTDTILKFISELEELEKKATPREWKHEKERYSARNVIGVKPNDDRWVASCQPEFNGYENAEFIAHSRNSLPKLLAAMRILVEACEFYSHSEEFESLKDLYKHDKSKVVVDFYGDKARKAIAECLKEIEK